MYMTPCWRRGFRDASARARQAPVTAHSGPPREFLRRHGRDVSLAAQGTKQDRARLVRALLPRVADPRNLFLAFQKLSSEGGQAPGPDGLRYADLSKSEVFAWARAAGKAILAGTYRPGPERCLQIPKASGKGTRTIRLTSILDRAVGRALTQILQPVLDPLFLPTTVGYRPGMNSHDALALAELHARRGLRAWVCEDVKDAFNQIPQRRLLDVLRRHLPDDELMRLLEAVIVTPSRRGVPQGGCLSPLLLNLYLHHHLDEPWARRHQDTVLIRVADDLLVLCPDVGVALGKHEELKRLLTPAGMPLKGTRDTTVHDLGQGQQAHWLGYSIRAGEDDLVCSITEKAWSRLSLNLEEASKDSLLPVRVWDITRGWVNYLGPCYRHEDARPTHARIRSLIRALGLEETPSLEELRTWWSAAHARWGKLRHEEHALHGEVSQPVSNERRGVEEPTAPPVAPPPAETGDCPATSVAGEDGQGAAHQQQHPVAGPCWPGPAKRRRSPAAVVVGDTAEVGRAMEGSEVIGQGGPGRGAVAKGPRENPDRGQRPPRGRRAPRSRADGPLSRPCRSARPGRVALGNRSASWGGRRAGRGWPSNPVARGPPPGS